jgi:hypothetical protein
MLKSRFEKELRRIIQQGDTVKGKRSYRAFIRRIVEIHRESFTEENIPTTESYLTELLHNAIVEVSEAEEIAYKIAVLNGKKKELERKLAHD